MRDPHRIERITHLLRQAWDLHPDWRLGQLLSNLLGPGPHDLFYVEDHDWETLIEQATVPPQDRESGGGHTGASTAGKPRRS